ncbi:MAG: hypothetical protein HN712_03340 [Gemmatimonadetes bacterium]|nr:hypothetical protein [Gemmatimonadota bacterium]MBT6145756.1 hypothetical protein [Gemmatimonadota bacterium]MBT7859313.1 hypothetical protein [Gemmatimonadota bacterium]
MIWDLIQQVQLSNASNQREDLETRVQRLESQLRSTNNTMVELLKLLEKRFGEDLDGDGRIG